MVKGVIAVFKMYFLKKTFIVLKETTYKEGNFWYQKVSEDIQHA